MEKEKIVMAVVATEMVLCFVAAGYCFKEYFKGKKKLDEINESVEDFKEKRHKDLEAFKEARKRGLIRCEKIEEFMKETDEDKAKEILKDIEESAKEDAKTKEDLEEHKRKAKENIEFLKSLRKEKKEMNKEEMEKWSDDLEDKWSELESMKVWFAERDMNEESTRLFEIQEKIVELRSVIAEKIY